MPVGARRLIVAILFAVLLIGGDRYVTWLSLSGPAAEVDISKLPLSIPGWKGEELEVPSRVVRILNEGAIIQRLYRSEAGDTVVTSLVYSDKWESLHSPQGCLKGAGYEIVRETTVDLTYDQPPRQARATLITAHRKPDDWIVELYIFADAKATSATWLERHAQIMLRYGRAGGKACAKLLVLPQVKGAKDVSDAMRVAKDFTEAFLPYVHKSMQG